MTNLLIINSSPKSQGSLTTDLTARFAETFAGAQANAAIKLRDVGTTPPPHLSEETIGAFFTPTDDRSDAQKDLVALSDELVDELEWADVIVLGAPMHNFSVTSGLKSWIDQIARVGRTFSYTANGPEGLLKGKKAIVLSSRGGRYAPGTPLNHLDQQEPHLRTVLGFVGITDVSFIYAEGTASGDDGKAQAETEIDTLVAGLSAAQAA